MAIVHNQVTVYDSDDTLNVSGVAGTNVSDALDNAAASGIPTISFAAEKTTGAGTLTGDGTIYTVIFNTEHYDVGSDYDTSTGIFFPNVRGVYECSLNILFQGLTTSHNDARVWVTGNDSGNDDLMLKQWDIGTSLASGATTYAFTHTWNMVNTSENVQIKFLVAGSTKVVGISGEPNSLFSAKLVSAF